MNKKLFFQLKNLMDATSFDSNPILRFYSNFVYKTGLEYKFPLIVDRIDRVLVKVHFLIFDAWINKKLRQYINIMQKNNGLLNIFHSEGNMVVYSKEYLFIKRKMSTFLTHLFIHAIAKCI